jgi:hypothetical protein
VKDVSSGAMGTSVYAVSKSAYRGPVVPIEGEDIMGNGLILLHTSHFEVFNERLITDKGNA